MAKLKMPQPTSQKSVPAAKPTEVKQPESGASSQVQQTAGVQVPVEGSSNAGSAVPFAIQGPGEVSPVTGKPNLVQKRQEKIKAAIEAGSPFTFVGERRGQPFTCICGAEGKNALVLHDKNGQEVLVGSSCVKYAGVDVPKTTKGVSKGSNLTPGISRQQKFSDALGKFTPPFAFARKEEGPFVCLCGGRGTKQIVVRDASGAEFSVGATCAALIPGVEVPKPQRVAQAPAVAGLKGQTAAPPDFGAVS